MRRDTIVDVKPESQAVKQNIFANDAPRMPSPVASSVTPLVLPSEHLPVEAACAEGQLCFLSSSFCRQHPTKAQQNYIYADAVLMTPTFLGICDGVSGVQPLGIRPDELPKQLLRACGSVVDGSRNHPNGQVQGQWLGQALHKAYNNTTCQGATTVLLAAMEQNHVLVVVNIGDCGMLLLRPVKRHVSAGSVALSQAFRTEVLRFGNDMPASSAPSCPMQVARLDMVQTPLASDMIDHSRVDSIQCCVGDVLVFGSDGVFDNIDDTAIAHIIAEYVSPEWLAAAADDDYAPNAVPPTKGQLARAAEAIVEAAIRSVDIDPVTGDTLKGNADDTTCMVAAVMEAGASGPRVVEDLPFIRRRAEESRRSRDQESGHDSMTAFFMPQCCRPEVDGEMMLDGGAKSYDDTSADEDEPASGCTIT